MIGGMLYSYDVAISGWCSWKAHGVMVLYRLVLSLQTPAISAGHAVRGVLQTFDLPS